MSPFDRSTPAERAARQARRWVVRLDRGGLTPRELARLKTWLADDEHARALRITQEAWSDLDAMPTSASPSVLALRRWRPARATLVGRRPRLAAGGALAACLALSFAAPPLTVAVQADARTAPGEQRTVVLEDGSRLTLNTASAVDIRYAPRRRVIRLLKGEARFEAAANRGRPFVVETAGGSVTALGTIFVVRALSAVDGGGASVTGVEHQVLVQAGGRGEILDPGRQTAWRLGGRPMPSHAVADPNAAGWSDGALEFQDVGLAKVAVELDRYSAARLLVVGKARELRVSGVFLANDPLAGLAGLESAGRITLTRLPGLVVVRAPAAV
jgi:transmembrane sensor